MKKAAKTSRKATKRKAAKKVAQKRTVKKTAKNVPGKKYAKKKAKKKVAKKKPLPPGFKKNVGGLIVPSEVDSIDTVVEPSRLAEGVRSAKREVRSLIDELEDFAEGYDVSEVSLEVSFSADGKFLGVGVGGATSLGLKLTPSGDND